MMSCLSPIIVNRTKAGRYIQDVVPCGRCPGCIAARQNDYVLRFFWQVNPQSLFGLLH